MRRSTLVSLVLASALILLGLGCSQQQPSADLSHALLLSLAVLEESPEGPVPQPAQLGVLSQRAGEWSYRAIEDPDSNVFHKAMVYQPPTGPAGILTGGGSRAIVKLWRRGETPTSLWEQDFGGKFSRMRDMEVGDIFGTGDEAIAVATHDQGVVAVLRPVSDGSFEAVQLDHQPNTFVHEIELGDLDGDGIIEIYATPSLPNKLDGSPQPGAVVRYVPGLDQGRTVVADLGDRHAKEILVDDIDGDGRDELYVAVEAVAGGRVRIVRFDADTAPSDGMEIANLDDTLCRFLTAGDIEGDGTVEMVAATHKSGLWLLRSGPTPDSRWQVTSIDRKSSGFEHAAILVDLDDDGRDELYVANDAQAEVNRYVWRDGQFHKELLYVHPEGLRGFTWNLMPVPVEIVP